MSAVVSLPVRLVDPPFFKRAVDQAAIKRLAESFVELGQKTPITVRLRDKYLNLQWYQGYEVVAGYHRLLAAQSLGWETIDAFIMESSDENTFRLWTIAENLHRAELTALERSKLRAEWVELASSNKPMRGEGVSGEVRQKLSSRGREGEGRPEGGIADAARQLDVPRTTLRQDIRIASLSEEAQAAAVKHGLDDNQSALLEAAKEAEPAKQVEVIQNRAAGQKAQKEDSSAAMELIKKHLGFLSRVELMGLLVLISERLDHIRDEDQNK